MKRTLALVIIIAVLNVYDAVLTTVWVSLDLAKEANPLMRPLLEAGAVPFVSIKFALVSLGLMILWNNRNHWLAQVGLHLMALIYGVLIIYHTTPVITHLMH